MTAETPTPLTDALIEQLNIEPWLSLSTKCAELEAHARQRERRCAELEQDVRLLRKAFLGRDYDHLEVREAIDAATQPDEEDATRCAELERENANLRREKERLDWLEKISSWYGISGETETKVQFAAGGVYPLTVRAAIDAAMREASPPADG